MDRSGQKLTSAEIAGRSAEGHSRHSRHPGVSSSPQERILGTHTTERHRRAGWVLGRGHGLHAASGVSSRDLRHGHQPFLRLSLACIRNGRPSERGFLCRYVAIVFRVHRVAERHRPGFLVVTSRAMAGRHI
jgi:hypothetical protein